MEKSRKLLDISLVLTENTKGGGQTLEITFIEMIFKNTILDEIARGESVATALGTPTPSRQRFENARKEEETGGVPGPKRRVPSEEEEGGSSAEMLSRSPEEPGAVAPGFGRQRHWEAPRGEFCCI